ncbi:MAG TPA: 4-alpha-glucanotransferase [Ignavibacteriaceae bacterium]|nr:4-alpha-glucanotransferase [Ignavibacteriaceae bacterium]
MKFERSAGILLHPTSLPGKYGIGDLGYEVFNFINFLEASGQKLWQVFPLGPTGYGDSPYQCFSAFAGNPNLISPEKLRDTGFLSDKDIESIPSHNPLHIDYGLVIDYKKSILNKAFKNFKKDSKSIKKDFEEFIEKNKDWLEDFSLFMAAKEFHKGVAWPDWDKDLVVRKPEALKKWKENLSDAITYNNFVQYIFQKQWNDVKTYANSKGIKIIGDMPIFVAYDSSDVWANNKIFTLTKEGKLEYVAGVPPDYFSATGQLWGNPLFIWEEMEKDDFKWWRNRFTKLLELIDIIRIDHFRGFEAYWRIPGDAKTAQSGKWIKAPGEKLFTTLKKYFGELPILAEDLGVITKPVEELRDKFEFPGMKILQFAFGTGMDRKFLPHNIIPNSVVYTGSHDNDTTRAYFEKEKKSGNDIYAHVQKYLDYYGDDIVQKLIKTAYATVADIVIIPMQDVLNLGGEARMNFPGKPGGNWTWRFTWKQVPDFLAGSYKELAELYERPPKPKVEVEIETE